MASDPESFDDLCTQVKDLVPEAVGKETWYLIIATVLTASPNPSLLASFYTHLVSHASSDTSFESPTRQPLLSQRLRDVLMKLVTLIGAPPVIVAVSALAKAEGEPEQKAATSELSEKWKDVNMTQIRARGEACIDSIYGPLLPKIFSQFGTHSRDIQHMEISVVYGLYLSDHTVLNAIESEVVVLVAILCTGLRSPGLWHLRGLARLLGARGEDAKNEIKDVLRGVKMAAMRVVEFCGEEMDRRVGGLQNWPNVGDVSRELGGFGDDDFVSETEA